MNKRGAIAVILLIITLASIITFVNAQTSSQELCIIQQGCSCIMDNSCRTVGQKQTCEGVKQNCIKTSPPARVEEKTEIKTYNVILGKDLAYFRQVMSASKSTEGLSPQLQKQVLEDIQAQAAAAASKTAGSSVKVTCTYNIPNGQDKPSIGAAGKCVSEGAWDIGAPGFCSYPIQFDINILYTKPDAAIITGCREIAAEGVNDPIKNCGFKFNSCETGEILVADASKQSSPPAGVIFSNSDLSKLPSLDWAKIFYLAVSVGILAAILSLSHKQKTHRFRKSNRISKLHHFLDSNKYHRSLK